MLIEAGTTRVAAGLARRKHVNRLTFPRALVLLAITLALFAGALEVQTSWLQSRVFSAWAGKLSYTVESGAADLLRHPHSGPYDRRLGHSYLSEFLDRIEARGFTIDSQARVSPAMAELMDWGIPPAYREKDQAGLEIRDRAGRLLWDSRFPRRVYESFDDVPPLVAATLLFIENREVLDARYPYKNPALEWDRLAHAAFNLGLSKLGAGRGVTGGSTLATQLEKMRHSPGGRTGSVTEKGRQMLAASIRAYAEGPVTTAARRRVVADYLNSIPLAAIRGYGEVYGLKDGLWAWFGADPDLVDHLLTVSEQAPELDLTDRALAYRRVLTLLLAIKKPTEFLAHDRAGLAARVNAYLRLLHREGVISKRLCERALVVDPGFRDEAVPIREGSYARRKATDRVRIELLQALGLPSVYDLDRLDLSVDSALDRDAQFRVADFLSSLADPDFAARAGLKQYRLLAQGDPAGVIYSVTLYERGPGVNYLRVQSDNLNQPLNVSEGTKLELGSTAKLRTLASYLNAVAGLHDRLAPLTPAERSALEIAPEDRITRWAVNYLNALGDTGLPAMLEAAMERTYSADPDASFFTGGGLHRFSNFDAKDNTRRVTVREALRRSVNLAFVRLMRDLVHYHIYRLEGVTPAVLTDPKHPARPEYLERFAQREGRHFLTRYYQKYQGLKTDEALHLLASEMRRTPRRLAAVYRLIEPDDGVNGFAAFLIGQTLNPYLKDELIEDLYREFAPGSYSLADLAYIAGVDPLELWLIEYKSKHPDAGLGEIFRESDPYCRMAYEWLFKSRHRRAQNRAIRVMLEVDAFRALHREWQTLGYPFRFLVPSYATALGSSGDTPAALAELVGIITEGGVRHPSVRVEKLHFAAGTPFESNLVYQPAPGERVMQPEIASLLRNELVGVVETGTGRRAFRAVRLGDGAVVPVGGKTGTGDNRYEVFGPGGHLIESRVINRTATFVFLIGDRFYGTVTAFVPGQAAAQYGFTSSLPVQIFKELAPAFAALIEGAPAPDLVALANSRSLPKAPVPQTAPSTPPETADSPST